VDTAAPSDLFFGKILPARSLAIKGHDTRAIQGWLGHRSITSTAVYTALAPNRFKNFWRDRGRINWNKGLRRLGACQIRRGCDPDCAVLERRSKNGGFACVAFDESGTRAVSDELSDPHALAMS
jgi:hypothetical protein